MKLSCALVLTLTNLVIATPFSFSAKGSGASAKTEAATLPYGQFAVVKPVASTTGGFSGSLGSFSKSSSASFASNSASSSAYNYNAGQVGTASLAYGSPGLPKPSHAVGQHVVTAFADAGANAHAGASANAQATGSYSSHQGDSFSVNTNSASNSQYQSIVPQNKPSSYGSLSTGKPGYWQENNKPNSLNANVPEHREKLEETPGVQSVSGQVQSGSAFLSTPSTPTQGTVSVENEPSYTGGFGGPPGFLNPHDKISSVGSNAPSQNVFLSYQPGAQLGVPNNKQQNLIYTPVSTINPSYAQNEGSKGNINSPVQAVNNDYVYYTENSKPSNKPEIDENKQTASNSFQIPSSEFKPTNGQHFTLQPHTETSYTTDKELGQVPHSAGQYSLHSENPLTNSHVDSKPIKNIQIFIQPVPSNVPQTSSYPVHFTNTQLGSESNKEVKPNNQYAGGFSAPAGILKPSGQSVPSSQTFPSSPVKIEKYQSSPIGLTTTGAKETTYGTGFGGSLNEIKTTAQTSLPSTNYQSFDSGSSSPSYVTSKPSSSKIFPSITSASVSNEYESNGQKGTEQFLGKPSQNSLLNPTVSSWVQSPTPNSLPLKPDIQVQKKPIGPNSFNTLETSNYSPEHGFGGASVSIDKTKPTGQSVTYGEVSEDVKPTIQSTITNNAFVYSNTPYKPVVTPAPFNTYKPNIEITNQKESAFASFSTSQPTPVNSWQQSTYKPSVEESSTGSSTPDYSETHKTSPTKYPSFIEDISKQSEKSPSGTYSNVDSPTVNLQATSNVNHQTSNYGSTAASFVAQEPTAQVNYASPTLTSFSQQSSYKPSIQNSLATSSGFELSESPITSPSEKPLTSGYSVSKEVYKVPTQIVSNNAYPPGSAASVFHLYPNSETSQQSTSDKYHQSTNYGSSASFVTQKPSTSQNFAVQTPGATAGLTPTSFSQQSNKPTVENSLITGSLSGSTVSSNVSPTQKPLYAGAYSVSEVTQTTPTYTSLSNSFSGKPQTQSSVTQQFADYQSSSSLVTKEPTASVASQTIGSTSAISESTTYSQQSSYKPSAVSSSATSSLSGSTEIPKTSPSKYPTFTTDYTDSKETQKTPSSSSVAHLSGGATSASTTNWFSGRPQNQFPTKPTVEIGTQQQPLFSNTFGTFTGAVKPSSYSSPSSSGYPSSTPNFSPGSSYVTGSNDKPKQTIYFNQNKPTTTSSFPEKKETLNPSNQSYSTTAKPSLTVASLNVQQSSSITGQKEKESTITTTSGSGTSYSKPTAQPILSNSGVSSTYFATPKPTKPTNPFSTGNSAFPSFGSSSLSQVKPQYQFSTAQAVTQKKQWNTNNYGTFGAVKPNSYTYPGFTSSFTSFGHGSTSVAGLYDKTKQTTQYTSTSQYKPTSTGQYNPSVTGQYKPTSTGQYKPTYNWGFAGQSGSQKPFNQPTQTGGSFISTYTQTTSKPIVAPSSFDKLKPTGDVPAVTQKESSFSSSFASSSGITKPTNQPLSSEISYQTSNTGVSSASSVTLKPTSSVSSYESVTGSSLLVDISDKGKVTSTIISTTPKYDLQKPISSTGQTGSNTYLTSSVSAKPTADLQENKPTHSYTEQYQVAPSAQTYVPTKDVENSELSQSSKPVWSSASNQKESSYASYTGVASNNLNPTSPSADDSNNSHYVDKTQTIPVKPTSSVDYVGQTTPSISTDVINTGFSHVSGSHSSQKPINEINGQGGSTISSSLSESSNTNQTPIPFAQKNPQFSSYQQSSQPFSSGVIYQGNTEFHSNSQVQPTNLPVDLALNSPKKPEYSSFFGESSIQLTPPKQGSLEVSSGQKESVSTEYYSETDGHSKPANTPVAGSISGYSDQPNVYQKITPTLQETHSNIAGAVTSKPPGQYWLLNSQSTSQQTAFQTTKPNIKITVVGKPSNTIVSPSYAGDFGGPSGILKPNDFSISSNQGNVQSQYEYPSHNNEATSGAYSSAKVASNSYASSYTGGFGGASGVLKPDEKHSTINHAVDNKPSINGFYSSPSQGGAQASYNVAPSSQTSGTQGYIKEPTFNGAQVSAEVQGNAAANAATSTNASGFVTSDVNAGSNGFAKTSNTFGGQFGGINESSTNAKGSTTASATSSGFGGSFTSNSATGFGSFPLSPGRVASFLGRR